MFNIREVRFHKDVLLFNYLSRNSDTLLELSIWNTTWTAASCEGSRSQYATVHILRWSRKGRCNEELICLWFQSAEHLWLVRPIDTHGHQHWISKDSSAYQSSSFVWTELLLNFLVPFLLSLRLRPLIRVWIFYSLQSRTSSKEFDIVDHTRPRKVPFLDWLDSCYFRRTQPRVKICPNYCHNQWRML